MNGKQYLAGWICLLLFVPCCGAMQRHMPYAEIAGSADLIVVGTVDVARCRLGDNGKMIFTDVTFTDLNVAHAVQAVTQERLTLSFAGGELNGEIIRVSDVPVFEVGKRYLLYLKNKKGPVASPVVGVYQGVFRILQDKETGKLYPLTYGGRGILGVDEDGELETTDAIETITAGVPIYKTEDPTTGKTTVIPQPAPGKAMSGAVARVSSVIQPNQPTRGLLTLEQFLSDAHTRAQKAQGR